MLLPQIIFFSLFFVVFRLVFKNKCINRTLLIVSVFCIYLFQPISTIRTLDFWLPSLLLSLSIISWSFIFRKTSLFDKDTIITLIIVFLSIFIISLTRFFDSTLIRQFVSPPSITWVVLYILISVIFAVCLFHLRVHSKFIKIFIFLSIFTILLILKNPFLSENLSILLRRINNQSTELANASEIAWIGFSYFAFRLLHVLFDQKRFMNTSISLNDFIVYLLFFPAFTAGPIARLDQFTRELQKSKHNDLKEDFLSGGLRIFRGLFAKFIIADSLAVFSIGTIPTIQIKNSFWLWIMVYAFAIRIFMDFSGYTDIAIGLSQLVGINLPENFKKPYLSENIMVFWNRWHITLTQWFRTYYFNPLVRFLRTSKYNIPSHIIIFFTQISTMILIALWHGITLNFLIWGLWNGLGLFIHNRWDEFTIKKKKNIKILDTANLGKIVSIMLTFNFVSLGWIWFVAPNLSEALLIFQKLFGLR